MIYLQLFLNFLKIGALSFGGGYGMIAVVKETVISNAWLTETEFLDFVAVAESTPGPLAVNMATFVGSSQGGFLGALTATIGVIFPSFVIILLLAAIINNLLKFAHTSDNFFRDIRNNRLLLKRILRKNLRKDEVIKCHSDLN